MFPKLTEAQEKLHDQLQNELKDWLLNVSEYQVSEALAYEHYRYEDMGFGCDFYEWTEDYYDIAYIDDDITIYYPIDRNYFLDFLEYYIGQFTQMMLQSLLKKL